MPPRPKSHARRPHLGAACAGHRVEVRARGRDGVAPAEADYVVVPLADGDLLLEEPGGASRTTTLKAPCSLCAARGRRAQCRQRQSVRLRLHRDRAPEAVSGPCAARAGGRLTRSERTPYPQNEILILPPKICYKRPAKIRGTPTVEERTWQTETGKDRRRMLAKLQRPMART